MLLPVAFLGMMEESYKAPSSWRTAHSGLQAATMLPSSSSKEVPNVTPRRLEVVLTYILRMSLEKQEMHGMRIDCSHSVQI